MTETPTIQSIISKPTVTAEKLQETLRETLDSASKAVYPVGFIDSRGVYKLITDLAETYTQALTAVCNELKQVKETQQTAENVLIQKEITAINNNIAKLTDNFAKIAESVEMLRRDAVTKQDTLKKVDEAIGKLKF